MARHALLAFDLGAESGRAFAGLLEGGRLEVRELSRFANVMTRVRGHLHWDVLQLLREMEGGLGTFASDYGDRLEGVGVDTWGVDFGLLGADGGLLGFPYVYRDKRIEGAMEGFLERVSRERVYELTGIQLMPINTLYQLYSMVRDGSPLLEEAADLLFMPDLFAYLLSGEKVAESTIASTSQLYDPRAGGWAEELFEALGISTGLMQEIVEPGTVIGSLDREIRRRTGVGEAPVIATAGHDTAAAVAAVPAEGEDWAYISSGTWSLMGVESGKPIITRESRGFNFTNEGGVAGTFRVLKNIMGLWLVQQCRKAWAEERAYSYEELTQMAAAAEGEGAIVEPDHPSFLNPPDMPAAIREFCERTGQRPPETPGEFVRCVLVSLALKYRLVLEQLRRMCGRPIARIHVVGGGTRNELLSQLTADATGLPVICGPVEAAAIGNVLVQAMALGHVGSVDEIREVVRRSFEVRHYEPQRSGAWEGLYERFCGLQAGGEQGGETA